MIKLARLLCFILALTAPLLVESQTASGATTCGATWEKVSPFLLSGSFTAVAWNGSKYVAVADDGSIATSSDGANWVKRVSGTTKSLNAVIWDGKQFIAAGADLIVLTSPDGVTWTTAHVESWSIFLGLATSGKTRVAVGGGGMIYASSDGKSWNGVLSGYWKLNAVTWSGTQFVAVGHGGTLFTSPDGTNWTKRDAGTSANLNTVAWNGSNFVVGSDNGYVTSRDGVTWSRQRTGTFHPFKHIFSYNKIFYAMTNGLNGETKALVSSDGVTWTANPLSVKPFSTGAFAGGTHGRSFVLVGSNGAVATSSDWVTWAARSPVTTNPLNAVMWTGQKFIAVGDYGTVIDSTGGASWIYRRTDTTLPLNAVAWNGRRLVAVGGGWNQQGSPAAAILTSDDGATWTSQTAPKDTILYGVSWNGKIFVAAGMAYDTVAKKFFGAFYTSTDAKTWVLRTDSSQLAYPFDITWSGKNFVAVAGSKVVSSPDGLTWTTVASGASYLNSIVWNGTRLLAAGYSGIYSSSDGKAWLRRLSQGFSDVSWSGTTFLAVGGSGAISTSPDGLTWTKRTSGYPKDLKGGAGNATTLVAVGAAILRSSCGP